MNKRIYGIIGIKSIMSNWNADFTGRPKSTPDVFFGSDKALKYTMKKMWEDEGKKVLYIKSLKFETKKGKINPRSLIERYKYLFDEDVTAKSNKKDIITSLFKAIDVKNFGATFAAEKQNISITGAVQIGQGLNYYKDMQVVEQNILSPFRDATKDSDDKDEAMNTTLGSKITSDEAHYFYPFVINPSAYHNFVELGCTNGYTEEDYQNFKNAAISSATAFSTNAKAGCDNELSIFIETESDLYLPTLTEFIEFEKVYDKNKVILNFDDMLNKLSHKILSVEIYYDSINMEIESHLENVKYFDIYTRKEI